MVKNLLRAQLLPDLATRELISHHLFLIIVFARRNRFLCLLFCIFLTYIINIGKQENIIQIWLTFNANHKWHHYLSSYWTTARKMLLDEISKIPAFCTCVSFTYREAVHAQESFQWESRISIQCQFNRDDRFLLQPTGQQYQWHDTWASESGQVTHFAQSNWLQ